MPDTFATPKESLLTGATAKLRLAKIVADMTAATYTDVPMQDSTDCQFVPSADVASYQGYSGASGKPGGTRKVVTGVNAQITLKTAGRLSNAAIEMLWEAGLVSSTDRRLMFEHINADGVIRRGQLIVPIIKDMNPVRGVYELDLSLEVDGEWTETLPA